MSKKIFFLILLLVLILPFTILAVGSGSADSPGGNQGALNGQDGLAPNGSSQSGGITIQSIVNATVQTALLIASGVVVILWIITGLLFLTAQGAPEKLKSARTALIAAVAGTALVIIAGSAIALVKNAFGLGG